MKKTVSLLCAVALLLVLAVPAQAADEDRDVRRRIMDIKETYNITVTYSKSVADEVPAYLDDLEEALFYVGPAFINRVSSHFRRNGWSFKVEIVPFPQTRFAGQTWIDALFTYNSERGYDQMISLYVKPEKQLKVSTIVHEFGHALHNCLGYSGFSKINGGTKSYPTSKSNIDSDRYVSSYAATDHFEDFAETFAAMVMRDADAREHYLTLKKNSLLYKKYHYVYENMEEFLGSGCRATKRAKDFLDL